MVLLKKKQDCATEITKIKHDYVTTTGLNAIKNDLVRKTF